MMMSCVFGVLLARGGRIRARGRQEGLRITVRARVMAGRLAGTSGLQEEGKAEVGLVDLENWRLG